MDHSVCTINSNSKTQIYNNVFVKKCVKILINTNVWIIIYQFSRHWIGIGTALDGVASTSSSSRRNRRSRDLDSVRSMSATEEQSAQVQQQQQAEPPNMSVWSHRILVRRLDRHVAECVSFLLRCFCHLALTWLDWTRCRIQSRWVVESRWVEHLQLKWPN